MSFEKKLFKHSLDTDQLNLENLEKNATFFAHETLRRDLPHVANWSAYFDSLFRSTDRAALSKNAAAAERKSDAEVRESIRGKGLVVFCKSFFFGLNKALQNTTAKTVLDYAQLKAFYYFAHEQPMILSEENRKTVGLRETKDWLFFAFWGFLVLS